MTRITFALSSLALSPFPPPPSFYRCRRLRHSNDSKHSPRHPLSRIHLGRLSLTHSSPADSVYSLGTFPGVKAPRRPPLPCSCECPYSTSVIFQSHGALLLLLLPRHPPPVAPASSATNLLCARLPVVFSSSPALAADLANHICYVSAALYFPFALSLPMYGLTAGLCRLCCACMQPLCSLTGRHAVGR